MKKERFIEIDRDNLNLLERMKSILRRTKTPSSSRKRQTSPTNASILKASDEQQYRRRVRQRMEVQFQNEKIAERLQSVKSVYNNDSLAQEIPSTTKRMALRIILHQVMYRTRKKLMRIVMITNRV